MELLQDILYKVHLKEVHGSTALEVNALHINSKNVKSNDVFIAIKGESTDGHKYIHQAIEQGAVAIVCQDLPKTLTEGITYIKVANTHEAAAYMANNFYQEPSKNLKLIGVTGTNGKTTVATVLFKLFTQLGFKCGLISTVQNQIDTKIIPATHTTPDALKFK
jgi:UDP-N-acetylmuramoyl-L-alanyl-D-glutamate--2,6-diaminopimelate ligase